MYHTPAHTSTLSNRNKKNYKAPPAKRYRTTNRMNALNDTLSVINFEANGTNEFILNVFFDNIQMHLQEEFHFQLSTKEAIKWPVVHVNLSRTIPEGDLEHFRSFGHIEMTDLTITDHIEQPMLR